MMYDEKTKAAVQKIPLLTVKAGPRDGTEWVERLKEELAALIKYVQINKDSKDLGVDGMMFKCCSFGGRDPCWVSSSSDRIRVAGARRKDAKDVSWRQDLFGHPLCATLEGECAQVWDQPRTFLGTLALD
eukprot:g24457.t1